MSDERALTDLRAELDRVRAELAAERASKTEREKQVRELTDKCAEANQKRGAAERATEKQTEEIKDLRARLTQATEQCKQLRASEEKARREATALPSQLEQLEGTYSKTLDSKQAKLDELKRQHSLVKQHLEAMQASQAEQRRQQQAADTARTEQDRALRAARDENERLRKEVQQLRATTAENDPLMFLMRSKVKLLHAVALVEAQTSAYFTIKGRRLPDQEPKTLRDAAIYAAYEARKEFYGQWHWGKTSKVHWIEEGRLLDPESEEKVRQEQTSVIHNLESELAYARRHGR